MKLPIVYLSALCYNISNNTERTKVLEADLKFKEIIARVVCESTLKKLVLSRPSDKSILRTEGRLITVKGETVLQTETFMKDGKALHKNVPAGEAPEAIAALTDSYRQINIISTAGDVEVRISSKGRMAVIGKLSGGEKIAPSDHNHEKNNILKEGNIYPFLISLGVCDVRGRVFDKKRSKFRQIDRFLHYINEIYPKLPDGDLYVLDLCCGKSYLTFASYWFLTEVKGRRVKMVGADLKADVIEYCEKAARELNYDGLSFLCCDINTFEPDTRPNLVLSLHACDVATDIVLTNAARLGADVILSTPCCHHQINSQLSTRSELGGELSALLQHSLIKQKLAVALTDALRCKRLEASGYAVDVTELIDPENTPKNLLIRAYRAPISERKREEARKEFDRLSALFGIELFGGNAPADPPHARIIYNKEEN